MNLDSIKNLPLSVTSAGNGLWTFTWASTGAAFYRVCLAGRLLTTTTALTYTTQDYSAAPPAVEVSELELTVGEGHPCRLTFQWYSGADVEYYLVEQYVSGAWVTVITMPAAPEVRSYVTPSLADGTYAQYRVTAYNATGDASSPLAFEKIVVTPPPAPVVSVAYELGDIVVESI